MISLLGTSSSDSYYPRSPYEFSVIPPDILGQVYERFLGKVIRLTAYHRAVVELKPEVRKAGGVYYTPTFIVRHIVERTLGTLLNGRRPAPATRSAAQSGNIKILDPACGSGSFLLGAYQYLLDWHREWYVRDGADKWSTGRRARIFRSGLVDWRLTTNERKRILVDCIHGVDIDPQAVEVTKLSLLLKVLEGETRETIQAQLRLFNERALPDLDTNVRCGNSLIEHDYYDVVQPDLLDDKIDASARAFDWRDEVPRYHDCLSMASTRSSVTRRMMLWRRRGAQHRGRTARWRPMLAQDQTMLRRWAVS